MNVELTKEEQQQYDRHLILDGIGAVGQLKLKQAKVLVIGAGGLSCPILQYLTAAGVGTLGIVDDDVVSVSNLQRQILYTHDDVGAHKVTIAAARLQKLNPYVLFHTYVNRLTKLNALTLFEAYDIIVDGTDNFPTRYLINDAAILTNKPIVFGSIFKFEGQVSVFNYKNGPSYRCLYPTPPKPNTMPNCSEIGVLGVLPGIIGCLQANEVLKIILGLEGVLSGKLMTFDAKSMQQLLFSFEKGESSQITKLADDYAHFCGLKTISDITYKEYLHHISDYTLLDVRTQVEYDAFHLESIHIPLSELPDRIGELPIDKPVVVACKSGIRSKTAIHILKDKNAAIVTRNLKGGLIASGLL